MYRNPRSTARTPWRPSMAAIDTEQQRNKNDDGLNRLFIVCRMESFKQNDLVKEARAHGAMDSLPRKKSSFTDGGNESKERPFKGGNARGNERHFSRRSEERSCGGRADL